MLPPHTDARHTTPHHTAWTNMDITSTSDALPTDIAGIVRNGPLYFDYNATTPVLPAVARAMLPCMTATFGNPSSSHAYGRRAKAVEDAAHASVAALIGASSPEEVLFLSGGTESINHCLKGVAAARKADAGAHALNGRT